ncbi:MAG: 5-formyltetrahydrofolate cyclo-ligase [Mobilitalea sp.]
MKVQVMSMTKAQIRANQKLLRNQLSSGEQMLLNKEVRERLYQTEAYAKCTNIFTFVSFGSEIDTHEIFHKAIADGKRVYVPRVEGKQIEFYRLLDLALLIKSKYGILEPLMDEDLHHIPSDSNFNNNKYQNLMLLPGLAFDIKGNRIGYGAGYYDKFLSLHMDNYFYKIAIGYDFQVLDELPAEEYDRRTNMIITPSRQILIHDK